MTRNVRCVTPAPSITRVLSSSIGLGRLDGRTTETPPPSRTGTRSRCISSRSPALMHCCTRFAPIDADVLVTCDRFRLRYGAFEAVPDERKRRSFVDPLLWNRVGKNKDRYVQGVSATPPVGEVECPPSCHQRPCRCRASLRRNSAVCGATLNTISVPGSLYSVSPAQSTRPKAARRPHPWVLQDRRSAQRMNPSSDVACPVRTFPMASSPFRPSSARLMSPFALPEPTGRTRTLRVVASRDLGRAAGQAPR